MNHFPVQYNKVVAFRKALSGDDGQTVLIVFDRRKLIVSSTLNITFYVAESLEKKLVYIESNTTQLETALINKIYSSLTWKPTGSGSC